MPSVALCVISREFDDNVQRIINDYGRYFNEVYIQINGGGRAPVLPPHIHVSYFKWVDDFAKARNALLKLVRTDFWMWIDTDDTIEQPDKIPELIAQAERENLDVILLPYDYDFEQTGEVTAFYWRERLMRTSHPYVWINSVHEALISPEPHNGIHLDRLVRIVHAPKTQVEKLEANQRNQAIMLREYRRDKNQPMLLHYLAISFAVQEKYKEALRYLHQLINFKEEAELVYDGWMRVADNYNRLDQAQKAIDALLAAIKLQPQLPSAYLQLGNLYLQLNQPHLAIEWINMGRTKKSIGTSSLAIDPAETTYRPLMGLAWAYLRLSRIEEAKQAIEEADTFEPKLEFFNKLKHEINQTYQLEKSLQGAASLAELVSEQGNPKAFIDGLPSALQRDPRLRSVWTQAYPPKQWGAKSIVFYCDQRLEEWGPDTIQNGLGGSEEAIVYLSPQLVKLGWDVTVYNNRSKSLTTGKVHWLPLSQFNPADNFNVLVAWRNPSLFHKMAITSKLACADMHDVPFEQQELKPEYLNTIDLVFFKSKYQRNLAPHVPDFKSIIISNGIESMQFKNQNVKRQPHKVVYASSVERGLDVLVGLWPQIKQQIPDAELVWCYGWEMYDKLYEGSPDFAKLKQQLKLAMQQAGVVELGRLGHNALVTELMSCSVWAYPTSFPEINCITALKAQAAGVQPVTSGHAALQETVVAYREKQIDDIYKKPAELNKFVKRVVRALKQPMLIAERQKISQQIIRQYDWAVIAKNWSKELSTHSKLKPSLKAELKK